MVVVFVCVVIVGVVVVVYETVQIMGDYYFFTSFPGCFFISLLCAVLDSTDLETLYQAG